MVEGSFRISRKVWNWRLSACLMLKALRMLGERGGGGGVCGCDHLSSSPKGRWGLSKGDDRHAGMVASHVDRLSKAVNRLSSFVADCHSGTSVVPTNRGPPLRSASSNHLYSSRLELRPIIFVQSSDCIPGTSVLAGGRRGWGSRDLSSVVAGRLAFGTFMSISQFHTFGIENNRPPSLKLQGLNMKKRFPPEMSWKMQLRRVMAHQTPESETGGRNSRYLPSERHFHAPNTA